MDQGVANADLASETVFALRKAIRVAILILVFSLTSAAVTAVTNMNFKPLNCSLSMVVGGQLVATVAVVLVIKMARLATQGTPLGLTLNLVQLKRSVLPSFVYVSSLFAATASLRSLVPAVYSLSQWATLLFVVVGQTFVLLRYESLYVSGALVTVIAGALLTGLHFYPSVGPEDCALVALSSALCAAFLLYVARALESTDVGCWSSEPSVFLYCNAVLGLCWTVMVAGITGDLRNIFEYRHWTNNDFRIVFPISCTCAAVAGVTAVFLVKWTSAVMFSMMNGIVSNLAVTVVGVCVTSEFAYEVPLWRLYGTGVTAVGCIFYFYFKFRYRRLNASLPR